MLRVEKCGLLLKKNSNGAQKQLWVLSTTLFCSSLLCMAAFLALIFISLFFGKRCLADAEDRKHFVPEKKSPDPTAHA